MRRTAGPYRRYRSRGVEGGPVEVTAEHKIDIESLSHEQREQLREILRQRRSALKLKQSREPNIS
jgi:hypothetical protein